MAFISMGGSASSLGGGESYSKQVKDANKFTDDVMTLFFTNASLKKLLTLHNIGECPKFVFTTSSELETLFQRIQIEPTKGKAGEIIFAPISDLSPAAPGMTVGSEKRNAEAQEKINLRNELCTDIAYFYVRIFQIYTALALTVVDAVPIRKQRYLPQAPLKRGPQDATLFGGAHTQRGGAVLTLGASGTFRNLVSSIRLTPFVVLLSLKLLDTVETSEMKPLQRIRIATKDKGRGQIYIQWDWPGKTTSEYEVKGTFVKGVDRDIKIRCVYDAANRPGDKIMTLSFTTDESKTYEQAFKIGGSGGWGFDYGDGTASSDQSPFFENIYSLYEDSEAVKPNVKSSSGSSGSSSSSSSGPSGISQFPDFDKLKKIFQDKTDSGAEFPKAYCIARAMTLMNPVFSSELLNPNQPYISQICRKKYDFEGEKDGYMPRFRSNASVNLYLRSVVSLYYDDYKYNRSTKQIDFSQSEPSKTALRSASEQFAKLYNIPGDQKNFLLEEKGGATTFTQFPMCKEKEDRLFKIKNTPDGKKLKDRIQTECIKPMLDFQLDHTKKVNTLLMKMFKIEKASDKNKTQIKLRLQPSFKAEGKDGVNKIGAEAHDLLLNYYLKSEAFYIRGVYIFEQNISSLEFM